jgi:hypothetical protein
MANKGHFEMLAQVASVWNAWRHKNRTVTPNLCGADLAYAHLSNADLAGANLCAANLFGAELTGAILDGALLTDVNLSEAKLNKARLVSAQLNGADLGGAELCKADLSCANLQGVDLGGAKLVKANLCQVDHRYAKLFDVNLSKANLTGCRVYGTSAWNLALNGAVQKGIIITEEDESDIMIDNLEVSQFVYLILHNEKIREVIDTIGKKGVLLLGRFTDSRITVLERLREELRSRGFLPMVFNFEKPTTKDFTETIRLLTGLSNFIIADITKPKSTPLELQAVVPDYMVPFVPIIEEGEKPFSMFKDLWIKYSKWVLEPIYYSSIDKLIENLDYVVIEPARARFAVLLAEKAKEMGGIHI